MRPFSFRKENGFFYLKVRYILEILLLAVLCGLLSCTSGGTSESQVVQLDSLQKAKPHLRYDYQAPISETNRRLGKSDKAIEIYMAEFEESPRYFHQGDQLDLDELVVRLQFNLESSNTPAQLIPMRVGIDKDVRMASVDELREVLSEYELYNVFYEVLPIHAQSVEPKKNAYLSTILKPRFTQFEERSVEAIANAVPNQIDVQLGKDEWLIQNEWVNRSQMRNRLRFRLEQEPDHIVNLRIDPLIGFGDYVAFISMHRRVVQEMRLEFARTHKVFLTDTSGIAHGDETTVDWPETLRLDVPIRVREKIAPVGAISTVYELIRKKSNPSNDADRQWKLVEGRSMTELHQMGMDTTRFGKSEYSFYSAEKFLYGELEGVDCRVYYSHRFGDERGKYVRIANENGSRDILLAMVGGDSDYYEIGTEFLNDSLFVEIRIDSEMIGEDEYGTVYDRDTTITFVKYDNRLNFTPLSQESTEDGQVIERLH